MTALRASSPRPDPIRTPLTEAVKRTRAFFDDMCVGGLSDWEVLLAMHDEARDVYLIRAIERGICEAPHAHEVWFCPKRGEIVHVHRIDLPRPS